MDAHNFKELKIWQQARLLVKEIYQITAKFPPNEDFGLTSQVRRAAISVPSNIAEGSGRGNKEFIRFLGISLSSAYELETQIILSFDLAYISENEFINLTNRITEIQRMIFGLQKKLRSGFLNSLLLIVSGITCYLFSK
jgi:four helix bundle protein